MQDASSEIENVTDLVSNLPEELLFQVTSHLDFDSLMRFKSLNKRLNTMCSKDPAGWIILCQHLWRDKVFVPSEFRNNPGMSSYRQSLYDSKQRQFLRREELIFDAATETGPIWSFRFKEAAGPDWTSWDPWWNGRNPRQMVFCSDNTLRQFLATGVDHQQDSMFRGYDHSNGQKLSSGRGVLLDPPVSMSWRFCEHPMDMPARPVGSYIRLSVGGRDVPTYVVRRSPIGNWGFLAESCWGVYTSFEIPNRRPGSNDYTNGDPMVEPSPFSDHHYDLLTNDSKFHVTNEVQWREALMYNFGATTLPEGEQAVANFDRLFVHTLRRRRDFAVALPGDEVGRTEDTDADMEDDQDR